jgi:tetratricopeptide (TPR) repeat protein
MTTVNEYLYKGKLFCELDRYANALKSFSDAIEFLNGSAISNNDDKWKLALGYNGKGVVLDSLEQYGKAFDCFEAAEKKLNEIQENNKEAKNSPWLNACFAMVYHNKGYSRGNDNQYTDANKWFDEAIRYFEEVRKKGITKYNTEYADTLRNKGYVLAARLRYEQNLQPQENNAFFEYFRQKYFREKKYRQLAGVDYTFKLAYDMWSDVLSVFDKDQLAEIFICFKRAVDIDDSFGLIYNTWGHVLAMFDEYELALDHFDEAIKKEGQKNAIPRHNKGFSNYYLVRKKQKNHRHYHHDSYDKIDETHRQAIAYFDEAIKIDLHFYQSWYYKGRVFYDGLREYEEALKNYDISLEINPKFPLAWYDKGRIYANLQRYEKAIECYDNVRKLFSEESEKIENKERYLAYVLYNKGAALDALGKFNEAKYNEALNCFNQAIGYLEDIQKDEKKSKSTPDLTATLALLYNRKGYTLGNKKCYVEALTCFEFATYLLENAEHQDEYRTEIADIWRNRGFVHAKLEEFKDDEYKQRNAAERCFNEALKDDQFAYGYNSKAFFYLNYFDNQDRTDKETSDRLDKAIKYCDRAITLFEQDDRYSHKIGTNDVIYPFYNLGCAKYLNGEYEKAIDCFDEAIRRKYDYVDAWYSKGIVFLHVKQYEKAIDCFDEATTLGPEHIHAWYGKGIALVNLERYEKAIDCFDQVLLCFKRNNDNENTREIPLIWYYKGYCNYYWGKLIERGQITELKSEDKYHEAIQCLTNAVNQLNTLKPDEGKAKIKPRSYNKDDLESSIYLLQGIIYYSQGKFSHSRSEFELMDDAKIDNQKKSIKFNNIGLCYYQCGTLFHKTAEESFRKAIESDSSQGNPYYHLAMLYDRQGKFKEARDILNDYPSDSTLIKEARMKMEKESTQPDWYNWWFSRNIAKKAIGIFLIAAIISPLVLIGTVIFNYYLIHKDPSVRLHLSNFLSNNAAAVIGLFTVLVGMVVAVLLLPNIQKFKVATLELEKSQPPEVSVDYTHIFQPVLDIVSPAVGSIAMLIVYKAAQFDMPVKYDVERYFMELDYARKGKMPRKILHIYDLSVSHFEV